MNRARARARGYLLSVLSAALTLVTLAYLGLAAYTAANEDEVQSEALRTAALYAAESAMLEAEQKLAKVGPQSPKPGVWAEGEFSTSQARYKAEVLTEGREQKFFRVLCTGTTESRGGQVQSVEYLAAFRFTQKTGWRAEWRLRND